MAKLARSPPAEPLEEFRGNLRFESRFAGASTYLVSWRALDFARMSICPSWKFRTAHGGVISATNRGLN